MIVTSLLGHHSASVYVPPVDFYFTKGERHNVSRNVEGLNYRVDMKPVRSVRPWHSTSQAVETGLVLLPFPIEHRYRGVELTARIEGVGRIVFAGVAYDSLSTAGGAARTSVAGQFPGRGIPQTNGWTFRQYQSFDGTLRSLDDLRRELYERKVINLPGSRASGR